MPRSHAVHRKVHFWNESLTEPPCGTPEGRFAGSGDVEDVTCEPCREALAGDSGDLRPFDGDERPSGAVPSPRSPRR